MARYAKPIRLTREQSRDLTRQRLLDAARAVFMKDGFAAASLEDITAAAGYTRGAFYSNFGSKLQLFLELLERDQESTMVRMRASLQATTTYITALAERMGPPLSVSTAELALGLSALFNGLQFYCLSNPQAVTNELIRNILTNLCARSSTSLPTQTTPIGTVIPVGN